MPVIAVAAVAIALLAFTAPAGAADDTGKPFPPVKRTLTASKAAKRHCFAAPRARARSVDTTAWRAPKPGFVTVRLSGARGDWDLALFDRRTKKRVASSSGFGATELAQTWIGARETLLVQGCRRSGRARSARVTLNFVEIDPPRVNGVPSLVRVEFGSEEELYRLEELGVDVTHHVHDGHADVVLTGQEQGDLLRRNGFTYTTLIPNLIEHYAQSRRADEGYAASVDGRSPLPSGRVTYRVYDEYQTEMKALAESHPDLVKGMTLPKPSFQGRTIHGVEIAEGVKRPEDGRPVYFVVAMHHAREWPSSEAAMEFAIMLAEGYGNDERITRLLRETRVVIVPLINPDGFISSRNAVDPADRLRDGGFNPNLDNPVGEPGDFPTDCRLTGPDPCDARLSLIESIAPPGGVFAYRRKNCDGLVPDGRVPCELQYGVDPNRNYGEGWGGPGSSGDPMDQTYRGTGPWSEPETQNVHEYSARRQVTTIITIHNVAALVLRPPGRQADGLAPDEPRMKEIGDAMGDATGYTSQYGWQLYDTSGTTEDWNYAAQGAYGYTIEIGPKNGEFHMPYETGFIDEWTGKTAGNGKGLREALMIGWEAAANESDHAVLEGATTPGRTLRLKKSFTTHTSPTCKYEFYIPLLNYEHPLISQIPHCFEEMDGMEVPDGLDTTMTVPESGQVEWHVNQSTRPFVGAGKVIKGGVAQEPSRSETFEGSGEPEPFAANSEHTFTITPEDATKHLEVTLDWPFIVEDYDLELYRKVGSEWQPFGEGDTDTGESANSPPFSERIFADDPPVGEYMLRVINFAGASNQWTAHVDRYQGEPDQVIPGRREAWTFTCEDNGRVLFQQDVFVDRGQRLPLDLSACGAAPAGQQQGGGTGEPGGGTGEQGGQPGSGDQPGASPNPRSAYRRCLDRANRIQSTRRRRAAKRRCAYRRCVNRASQVKGKRKRQAAKRRCTRRYGTRRSR